MQQQQREKSTFKKNNQNLICSVKRQPSCFHLKEIIVIQAKLKKKRKKEVNRVNKYA